MAVPWDRFLTSGWAIDSEAVAMKAAGIRRDMQDRSKSEADVWAAVWLNVWLLYL